MWGVFMFTTFSVEERELRGIYKIMPFLKKDKLFENYSEYKNMVVRSLVYVSYHSKVDYESVYQRAGYQAKCLVCSKDTEFPEGTGLKRFFDLAYYKKMAENFALNILSEMENPQKLRVAFFDMEGVESPFVEKLCKYTDNFTVLTLSRDKYFRVEERLMDNLGVSLVFSRNLSVLANADLIIAPTPIRKILSLSTRAVVITSTPPVFDVTAQCYYDYRVDLPQDYKKFLPKDTDEMYFASALYSKGRQHSLGELVPKVAFNENSTCTVKSLAKYLDKLP